MSVGKDAGKDVVVTSNKGFHVKKIYLPLIAVAFLSACFAPEHKQHGGQGQAATLDLATMQHPGAKVFQSACVSCHALGGKAGGIAPPAFGMTDHVKKAFPAREAFIAHLVKWVKAPNATDAIMTGAVKQFGLMPAMPQLSDADLTAVAQFLYDTDLGEPDWYKAHYEAEHGKQP